MDCAEDTRATADGFPPPLTPERVQRAVEHVAATRERIRRCGINLSALPDPVEELSKARAAGGWE